MLMVESGWTQDRIAEKVGKAQNTVSQLLCFGRFIIAVRDNHQSGSPGGSIPQNLTEWAFREAWKKAPKKSADGQRHTEAERFEIVRGILELWSTIATSDVVVPPSVSASLATSCDRGSANARNDVDAGDVATCSSVGNGVGGLGDRRRAADR